MDKGFYGALASLALVCACGSSEAPDRAPAPSGAGGASGGGGGQGGDVSIGCDPPCEGGDLCSVTNACIAQGTCAADGDCEQAMVCDLSTSQCVPGSDCGAVEIQAEAIPPNLLVVLDRSCSMTDTVNGVKKWTIAVQALQTITTSYTGRIWFGLALFPDLLAPACAQGAIAVAPGPGHEEQIASLLAASTAPNDPYYPNGPCVTNIDTAMQQAASAPELADPARSSYALLITDGKQSSCNLGGGDAGTTATLAAMRDAGVPTFVVGFGGAIDPAQMSEFATAGGVPAQGATPYYQADDQASLDAALSTIATKTLSCSFALEETPDDPDQIYVFFDNTESIPRDPAHLSGFDYDPGSNVVTFYGAACEELKAGEVDVDIVFGCDTPTPN